MPDAGGEQLAEKSTWETPARVEASKEGQQAR